MTNTVTSSQQSLASLVLLKQQKGIEGGKPNRAEGVSVNGAVYCPTTRWFAFPSAIAPAGVIGTWDSSAGGEQLLQMDASQRENAEVL